MEKVVYNAVIKAIRSCGVDNFKKTSLFLSNQKAEEQVKRAA